MCGIAGILSSDQSQLSRIRGMTHLLRHRGPDDEGFLLAGQEREWSLGSGVTPEAVYADGLATPWSEPPHTCFLAFGHRRLSIIDLTIRGHQPMCRDDRYWMVYNGEIFNYLELRAELSGLGEQFSTETDSEVVLAAYAKWGAACFGRFNGMWAIAIYDRLKRRLILSRDRFGVKPLYYWRSCHDFAFASEIKAFAALQRWHPSLNKSVVGRFLALDAQDTGSGTMFADVYQIMPGHMLTLPVGETPSVGLANRSQEQWYELRPKNFAGSYDEASLEFRRLFTDAVRLRLRSDVPVGFCLSGGLDSSSILCVAADLIRNSGSTCHLKSFTSCSSMARYDERSYAEIAAGSSGATAAYLYPEAGRLFHDLHSLIWAQDEPFASTSIFAQWCVFAAAAGEQLKVMLDGQGADESLCGYYNFHRPFLRGLVLSASWMTAWKEALNLRGNSRKAASALLRAVADNLIPEIALTNNSLHRRRGMAPAWLRKEVLESALSDDTNGVVARGKSAGDLSVKLLGGAHVQALLHWEDRNSMAHSIESRVPFLDYRLVEFLVGLPDIFKIKNGQTKAVLRSGLRGTVPDAILDRKDKLGFVTPEAEWVLGACGHAFRTRLEESLETAHQVLAPSLLNDFDSVMAGKKAYDTSLWRALCIGQWMRIFGISG